MPNTKLKYSLLLALLALLAVAGCAKKAEDAAEAETEAVAPVQVEEATLGTIERTVTAEGVLYPANQASVMPKISAPVKAFHVKRGDHVSKGQLLAELESRDLAATVTDNQAQQAQAVAAFNNTTKSTMPEDQHKAEQDVAAAKQTMDAAKTLLDSRQKSFSDGVIAKKTVDEANSAYVQATIQHDVAQNHLAALKGVGQTETTRNLQAQIDSAAAKVELAKVQLSYAQIPSPIAGVVTDRPLFEGEMASAGMPLMTIMDVSHVIARTNVPNSQLKSIKVGNAATILTTDGTKVAGNVTVISPALDPNSTTAEVWVDAANPNELLRPGSTVTVVISVETVKNALVVPATALLPNVEGMVVVMSVGSHSVAHEHEVEVGIRQADKVQILKGLEAGERVVTVGGLGLEDNAKVKIVKAGEKDDDEKDAKPADEKTGEKKAPAEKEKAK